MGVAERSVLVPVTVRRGRVNSLIMSMVVMFVMRMTVLVRHFPVLMLMFVTFGKMKPDAECHQGAGGRDLQVHCLAQ